jgi:hypothetical protein
MVLGGYGVLIGDTAATEISDSSGTGWTSSGLLSSARRGAAAVALADGRVLVSGGEFGTAFATAELWTPLTSLATFEDLLSFGRPAIGDRTSASVAIVNTGTEPLVVGDLGLGGAHARDFAVSRDRCGGPILPGTRCWLDVTFAPTAGGERQALLTFAANTAAQTYSLALRATAVSPPQPVVHADADGDGVPDSGDRCPALKGPAPRQGCPTGVVADPSIAYKRVKRGIKVVAYYVQATSGARVTVECSKGCKRTVTRGKGSRRVRIKALNGKRLANGARITVTVSAPGRLTTTVTDRISRGRRIEGRPRCSPVGC